MFRDAYRRRRCIIPVDGFFEWKAIKGQKAKQPYAIAMKDGKPFGLGGLWENWKEPTSGEWIRTFAIVTTPANEMVAEIHDRMPLILASDAYGRWLSDEPDPRDLMRPFPAEPMRMPSGNAILRGGDKGAELALDVQTTVYRDKMRARISLIRGLFAKNREISVCAGASGGPGSCVTAQRFQQLGLSNGSKSDHRR